MYKIKKERFYNVGKNICIKSPINNLAKLFYFILLQIYKNINMPGGGDIWRIVMN